MKKQMLKRIMLSSRLCSARQRAIAVVTGMVILLVASAQGAVTWSGLGAGNLASTKENWVGNVAPVANDDIVLTDGSSKNMTWDLDLPAQSWTQVGYTGTVTFTTVYGSVGFTNFIISADCIVSNGIWTHLPHPAAQATELYRLRVSVGGNFYLGPAAALDVSTNGFALSKGPGSLGNTGEHGGSYGGTGRKTQGKCYGSITAPTNPGSGSKEASGGGIIHLTVGGTLVLDGKMLANGQPTVSFGGSGGTVFITAGSITASTSGLVQANSSLQTTWHSGGGGGRIALIVTNAATDFADFKAECQTYGGQIGPAPYLFQENRSGAGTIYFETPTHVTGGGDLIIKGTGFFATEGLYTPLNDRAAGTFDFASITITNGGFLAVGTDDTLILTNTVLRGDPLSTRDGINIDGSGKLQVSPDFGITNLQVLLRTSSGQMHPSSSLTLGPGTELITYVPFTLLGDLIVATNANLTCPPNLLGAATYKLNLSVGGDLTIVQGGKIDMGDKGYAPQTGPGCATGMEGASYGGRGALGTLLSDTTLPAYGSIYEPLDLGSGGRHEKAVGSGGAKITVAGATLLNGRLLANSRAWDHYNSSGGSIWLTSGTLTGSGEINANGGPAWNAPYVTGGGGRIAVTLTDTGATFAGYTGALTAYGGWNGNDADNRGVNQYPRSGAGTIYLRASGEAIDEGTLIIDNADGRAVRNTEINVAVAGRRFKNVIIRNGGKLWLDDGEVIEVSGNFENSGMLIASNGAAVRIVGAPESVSRITGTTSFCVLECRAPGKIIEFEAGKTNSITAQGALILQGTSGDPVILRSTVASSAWGLKADASAGQAVEAVTVSDSDATSGAEIVAVNSTDVGGNPNWRFATAGANDVMTWTGASSAVWGASGNWDLNRPPVATDTVIIPTGLTRYPVLPGADVEVRILDIRAGASLSLNGSELMVQTNLLVAGTLTATADETVTLLGNADFTGGTVSSAFSTLSVSGTANQAINLSGAEIHNLLLGNSGGVVTLMGGCTAAELKCEASTGTRQINFEAGASFVLQRLLLSGNTSTTNILLRSTASGSRWNAKVTGYRAVSGVDVKDCDASSGGTVPADFSKDSGNNLNWDFSGAVAQWRGTSSTDFNTAANWLPAVVPSANARIVIQAPTRQLTITAPVTLGNLTLGSGTVRFAAPVTVADALNVLDKGIVIMDYPCVVSNSVTVMAGGKLTHTANSATELYKINLTVQGDATFEAGSLVDVSGMGYAQNQGPGIKIQAGDSGPCHGGRGDFNSATYPSAVDYTGNCYGSICAPTNCGSGGASVAGAGAIIMKVEGVLVHNGAMRANGLWYHSNSGAGGSIFLTVGQLKGGGTLQADGGPVNNSSAGGGGRIALVLTRPGYDFVDFTGTALAYGGRKVSTGAVMSGAGTVYWETGDEEKGRGLVVIANDINHTGYERYTDLGSLPLAPPSEIAHATVRVLGRGMVRILNDVQVGDLWIEPATTRLNLNAKTLSINTIKHDLVQGTISNYGAIVWKVPGTIILVR